MSHGRETRPTQLRSAAEDLSMRIDSLPISSNILAIVSGGISATRSVGTLSSSTLTLLESARVDRSSFRLATC